MNSDNMVNPLYKDVKEGYWEAVCETQKEFLKIVPEFPLKEVSYTVSGSKVQPSSEQTVEDIDLLSGYISEDFEERFKNKVSKT